MSEPYRTLKDLHAERPDESYSRLHRVASALVEAELAAAWRGQNNELRFTLEDARRIRRILGFLRNRETLGRAVELLRAEIQADQIEELQAEVRRLRALVEVRPTWMDRTTAAVRRWVEWFIRRRSP